MLSEKTFLEFATKSYCNPRCISVNEFMDDLARIKYVKRLLNRYIKSGDLQERLIVNHLVSIYNVFDIGCANEMLFFKCDPQAHSALKSFLTYLNYLPKEDQDDLDKVIIERLKDL